MVAPTALDRKSRLKEDQDLFEKTEADISNRYKAAGRDILLTHSRRTLYWLMRLRPDADVALKIAAWAHDIERLSPGPPLERMVAVSSKGFTDPEFLRRHSTKGSEIIVEILNEQKAAPEIIERVKFLVAGHEVSGTVDQNVLKDADSVSFFENNVSEFLQLKTKMYGNEKVREKFDWMYGRITSETARRIVEPWYRHAIAQLGAGEKDAG